MKYFRSILLICFLFLLQACGNNQQDSAPILKTPLGEVQSIWSEQKDIQSSLQKNSIISGEQEKLFEISDVFQSHALTYNQTLLETLQKYKSSLTQEDVEIVKFLLSENLTNSSLTQKILSQLSFTVLESDIETLKSSYLTFVDEKNVQKKRLLRQEDLQTFSLIESRDTLITNMIHEIITSKKSWTQTEKETIIYEVLAYFYQNNYNTEIESFTQIIETLENQYTTVINTETITSDSYDFDQLSFKGFMQDLTEQYKTTLSYSEHMQEYIEYITHENILNNVITEIQLIESEIPLIEYEALITENTTQLESIFKTHEIFETLTIEEVESYFTKELDYSDIEVLYQNRQQNLAELPDVMTQVLEQEYKDDSTLIADMTPLAYIEELHGNNILIVNLNGGYKIASENMLLYAGYTIETSVDSRASIIFSDESILRLSENSKVTLSESGENNPGIHMEYGNLWTRVIKPLFSQDAFEIDSQDVSLAVRGTSLYLQKDKKSKLKAYVVDSYVADGTQPVQLINKLSDTNMSLTAGELYQISEDNTTGAKQTFTKSSLMQQETAVSKYLRDDLRYLSLTLDDRKRGFYNNPISVKNDSQNFLDKLAGELDTSLPTSNETSVMFENSETPKTGITADTIYMRLVQDELITDVKNSSSSNKSAQISAITGINIESLEENIGNLREIENRLDLGISQEIISDSSISSDAISDIFIDFGLSEQQAQVEKLHRVKEHLIDTLNNGSPYISADIALLDLYDGVDISWQSSDENYLGHDGTIENFSTEKDIPVSLTATLKSGNQDLEHSFPLIIKKREASDREKLEAAYEVLSHYIGTIHSFTNTIGAPDFNSKGTIIPNIVWTTDEFVQSNGNLNRPSFIDGDELNHGAIATLSFGDATLEDKIFTLERIEAKAETQEEREIRLSQISETDKNTLTNFFKTPRTIENGINDIRYIPGFSKLSLTTPIQDIKWSSIDQGNGYIQEHGSVKHAKYSLLSDAKTQVTVTLPNSEQTFTISVTIERESCDSPQKPIRGECYDLVASAEYTDNYKLGSLNPTNSSNRPGFITLDGEKGVKPDRDAGSYLSYDLAEILDEDDDWVIEMSVRGQDLNRIDNKTHTFLSSKNSFSLINYNSKTYISLASGWNDNIVFTNVEDNKYYNLILMKKKLILDGKELAFDNSITSVRNIRVGHKTQDGVVMNQWDGIMNYFRIFKGQN